MSCRKKYLHAFFIYFFKVKKLIFLQHRQKTENMWLIHVEMLTGQGATHKTHFISSFIYKSSFLSIISDHWISFFFMVHKSEIFFFSILFTSSLYIFWYVKGIWLFTSMFKVLTICIHNYLPIYRYSHLHLSIFRLVC